MSRQDEDDAWRSIVENYGERAEIEPSAPETEPESGRMVSRGKAKRADYVLYFKPNIPLAVIEAKDNHRSVGAGIQQALGYATKLEGSFRLFLQRRRISLSR